MDDFLRYVYSDSAFFKDCLEDISDDEIIQVGKLPAGWRTVLSEDKIWISYYAENCEFDDQGWKLHISCTHKDVLPVLNDVSNILFRLNVPFKNIYTRQIFDIIHSKNANRITAGKFITIYPKAEILQETVEELYRALQCYDRSCYILSDRRYRDSNIYYRYGAFKSMVIDGKYCIKDSSGNYIEDLRTPYFTKPDFVEIPDFLTIDTTGSAGTKTKLADYKIEKAIKFSASGGIYYALRKKDGKPVVIKEARSSIGMDSEGFSAVERLRNEYSILNRLEGHPKIVKSIDYFGVWENEYLVEEFLDGVSLSSWVAVHYPFAKNKDKKKYIEKVKVIFEQICSVVDYAHSEGIGLSDLQPNNVIVDGELNCKLIDFESSGDIDENYRGLGTHGFSMGISNRRENDINAKESILKYLLLPISPVVLFDNRLQETHWKYIKKIFGVEISIEFKNYLENTEVREDLNLMEVKTRLLQGIEKNLMTDGEILAYGDVYSYLNLGGHFNYITGGMGIIYTLYVNGELNDICKKWIQNNVDNFFNCNLGLLDGQMGICNILCMIGDHDLSKRILQNIEQKYDKLNENDISVYSGQAGLILGYISISKLMNSDIYITKAVEIAESMVERLEYLLDQNGKSQVTSYNLVHGLSGSALALFSLYDVTRNEVFYEKAKQYLIESLGHLDVDFDSQMMQLKLEDNRLMPYMENGSIGIALVIYYVKNKFSDTSFDYFFEKISNTINLSIFYDASLFFGMGSELLMYSMIENVKSDELDNLVNLLNLYIVHDEERCLVPGRASMKLSNDVYTGSSGIVLGINALMDKNPFLWLPIKI